MDSISNMPYYRVWCGKDMGFIDNILGKKAENVDMKLEPANGGYTLAYDKKPGNGNVGRVCVLFNAQSPPYAEADVLKDLIKEHGLENRFVPNAFITTAYENIPEMDEYLNTQEIPESLNAFLMSRAMMEGIARGPAEMGKISVNPFRVKGTNGVLVLKEM